MENVEWQMVNSGNLIARGAKVMRRDEISQGFKTANAQQGLVEQGQKNG